MDKNAIAQELAELGKSDKRLLATLESNQALLAKLESNRARRCEILMKVAQHPDAGLSPDVMAASVQPKD
jgi:hypothetical protein